MVRLRSPAPRRSRVTSSPRNWPSASPVAELVVFIDAAVDLQPGAIAGGDGAGRTVSSSLAHHIDPRTPPVHDHKALWSNSGCVPLSGSVPLRLSWERGCAGRRRRRAAGGGRDGETTGAGATARELRCRHQIQHGSVGIQRLEFPRDTDRRHALSSSGAGDEPAAPPARGSPSPSVIRLPWMSWRRAWRMLRPIDRLLCPVAMIRFAQTIAPSSLTL